MKLHTLISTGLGLAIAMLLFIAFPVSAQDDDGLWFGNDTNETIWVVVRFYPAPREAEPGVRYPAVMPDWQTQGWYEMAPGKTIKILGKLQDYYPYYYYAVSENGKSWGGDSDAIMWIKDERLQYPSGNCCGTWEESSSTIISSDGKPAISRENGYYPVRANVIDVGSNTKWIEYLESNPTNVTPVPGTQSSTPYAIVCLVNQTNRNIVYDHRWGNEEWKSSEIGPYESQWHSWNYAPGSHTSPLFVVRFDSDFSTDPSHYVGNYELKRYRASVQDCASGKPYKFVESDPEWVQLYAMDVAIP